MGAFRDTVVKQAVKVANETATAAAARAKATAGAPPPPRPPSCADKYCIYLALRPMFEEGEGLCICTFSYLAPAAAAARAGRGAMLFALLGALMMAGGFGALSQRASYWLGVRSFFGGVEVERVDETFFERRKELTSLAFQKKNLPLRQVTAPASERARVAAGLFGGEGSGDEVDDEEGALRPKGAAAAPAAPVPPRLLSTSAPKAGTSANPPASAAAGSIHVSASTEGRQQEHEAPPPPRRTGSGGRVRSFFTGLSSHSPPRRG